MQLWRRKWDIELAGRRIRGESGDLSGLDLEFEVTKSLKKEPNTARLSVYNLHPDNRNVKKNDSIVIQAGYVDNITNLFSGKVRKASTAYTGADYVTSVEARDAAVSFSSVRVSKSWGPGTPVRDVLEYCVRALGVGVGNLSEFTLTLTDATSVYPEGTVVANLAHREIDRIVRSAGLTWSVQDGVFLLRRSGQPLRRTALRLTAETGLVEAVRRDADGTTTATALLVPGLYPGRIVLAGTGQYYVSRVSYTGSTFGKEWYAKLTLKDY